MKVLHTVIVLSLLKWASCTVLSSEVADVRDYMEQWHSHNAVKGSRAKGSAKNTYRECKDIPDNCATYKHLCEEKPQMMETLCAKTCGFCPEEMREVDFKTIGGEAKSTTHWDPKWVASNAFTYNEHGWHSGKDTTLPQSLWYEFEHPIKINRFSFRCRSDWPTLGPAQGPSSYIFWASNGPDCSDESTWTTLFSDLSDTGFANLDMVKEEYVNNDGLYKCYGFKVLKSKHEEYTAISNVHMYYSDIEMREVDFKTIGGEAKPVFSTEMGEVDFKTIGGEAKSTTHWDPKWVASNAFTYNEHGWHSGKDTTLPQNLWYEFDHPIKINRFSFRCRSDWPTLGPAQGPSSYIFWASNGPDCSDESTWTTLFSDLSDTGFDNLDMVKEEDVNNDDLYNCYGFKVLKSKHEKYTAISNVHMYYNE